MNDGSEAGEEVVTEGEQAEPVEERAKSRGLWRSILEAPSRAVDRLRHWREVALHRMAPPDPVREDGSREGFSTRKKLGLVLAGVVALTFWWLVFYGGVPALVGSAALQGGINAGL